MIVHWFLLLGLILLVPRGWSVKVFDFVDTRPKPAGDSQSHVRLTNNIGREYSNKRLPDRYFNLTTMCILMIKNLISCVY